jgi:hypothetical protein
VKLFADYWWSVDHEFGKLWPRGTETRNVLVRVASLWINIEPRIP